MCSQNGTHSYVGDLLYPLAAFQEVHCGDGGVGREYASDFGFI